MNEGKLVQPSMSEGKLHIYVLVSSVNLPERAYRCISTERHAQKYNKKYTLYMYRQIQLDLFTKDTLEPANLSTVERLSTLQR